MYQYNVPSIPTLLTKHSMVVVGCWNRYLQYDGVGEVSVLYDTHLMSKDEVGDRIKCLKKGWNSNKNVPKIPKKGGHVG